MSESTFLRIELPYVPADLFSMLGTLQAAEYMLAVISWARQVPSPLTECKMRTVLRVSVVLKAFVTYPICTSQ